MIRIITLLLLVTSAAFTAPAQESSTAAKNLKKEGLQKMALFTLTKEEALYTEASSKLAAAKSMYKSLLAKADNNSVYATLYQAGVESVESYELLYDERFKESITKDTDEQNTKVKYEGKEYKVSKNQKKKFELVELSLKPLLK